MKKLFFFCIPLLLAIGCLNYDGKRSDPEPELVLKESFFAASLTGEWSRAVPENARRIAFVWGRVMDLDQLAGSPGNEGDEAAVYARFHSSTAGKVNFGIGADWWCEVYLNGKLYFSTMKTGNLIGRIYAASHLFELPVEQGENLLAIKVRRGAAGWKMACSPLKLGKDLKKMIGAVEKTPWQKGTPPPSRKRAGASYQLLVLGDLHFDSDDTVYHADYKAKNAKLNRLQHDEFARNAAMWRDRSPRMIAAAARQITPKTRAVIQVGDLVQGDCGNPKVHSRMLTDILQYLKRQFHGLPILTVTGNHDIRGTGAEQAYDETVLPFLSGELHQPVRGTTFYTFIGEDLFLFIDFNGPDLEVITEALEAKARYRFVVTHGPIIPADDGSCRWMLLGHSDPLRRSLTELFLRRDVIVLTGHVHDLEFTECITPEGRITQLMANSVWSEETPAVPKTIFSKPEEYGKLRTGNSRKLLNEYAGAISRYWKADGAGYFVLNVSPDGINADFFGGDSATPAVHLPLR